MPLSLSFSVRIVLLHISHTQVLSLQTADRVIPLPHRRPPTLQHGPLWIIKEYKGSYQFDTLAGEILGKWVNGFRLKLYKGRMLKIPFQGDEDSQDLENRPIDGQVPGVTDPVQLSITGN